MKCKSLLNPDLCPLITTYKYYIDVIDKKGSQHHYTVHAWEYCYLYDTKLIQYSVMLRKHRKPKYIWEDKINCFYTLTFIMHYNHY